MKNAKLKEKLEVNSSSVKAGKSETNKTFYKVNNFDEVYKLGKTFHDDFKSGVKCFGITSTGYQDSQQRSILGVASLFDVIEDLNIGIISENLHEGKFSDFVSKSKKFNVKIHDNLHLIGFKFYDHFTFIDLNSIRKASQEISSSQGVFKQIKDRFDVLFYDVPELENLQNYFNVYFNMIKSFDSISIVVAQNLSSEHDVNELREFFETYGISLKGLLVEPDKEKNKGWVF